jgi:hypothetical protein
MILHHGGYEAVGFGEIELHLGSNKKARRFRGGRPFHSDEIELEQGAPRLGMVVMMPCGVGCHKLGV